MEKQKHSQEEEYRTALENNKELRDELLAVKKEISSIEKQMIQKNEETKYKVEVMMLRITAELQQKNAGKEKEYHAMKEEISTVNLQRQHEKQQNLNEMLQEKEQMKYIEEGTTSRITLLLQQKNAEKDKEYHIMKEKLGNIKLQRQHETNQHLHDIILKNNEQITSLVDVQ